MTCGRYQHLVSPSKEQGDQQIALFRLVCRIQAGRGHLAAVASSGVSKGKESGETGDTKKSEEKEREKEANKNSKGSNDKVEEASILAVLRRTQHTMSKETSRGSDEEKVKKNEKQVKEGHAKEKTKKSEEESQPRWRRSREAKTQCPEKSLTEELNSALRSEAEHEKEKELKKKAEKKSTETIGRAPNPEKSLMEEMEAALASEPSLPTGKGKREKQNLIPADVSLKVYTPPLPLDPTFHSEESDDRERNKNTL
ncbi:hypothetical protein RB195_011075 [Necator americanus]